jgi:proliferating cell nuclear antigen
MTITFNAKTSEAYHIKILAELLSNNIKTGCFKIDINGIRLTMMDAHRRILVDMDLKANNFNGYKFKIPSPEESTQFLGINLGHFHKMLKSIKKKDSLQLYIDDSEPNDLVIKVTPKENNRVTTSVVKIQFIQNLVCVIPDNYNKPVIVSSSEFQKMIKDMSNIGNVISVNAKGFSIQFNCDAGGILKRKVDFGEESSPEDDEHDEDSEYYEQSFATDQLSRITKMAGLSTHMKIFPGLPLLFQSNIGSLGEISVYIKSKEEIKDDELHTLDESDSE